MSSDSFGVNHGVIRRHVQMQVLFVDTTEGTKIRPERRARSFTTIAVDCTAAITIVIPGPFAGTVAHSGVGSRAPSVALPLVGVQLRAVSWNVCGDAYM